MSSRLLSILVLLAAAAAAAEARPAGVTPPCFGEVGYSRRGIDIGYHNATKSGFSSTHNSYWNYTRGVQHERYDVRQCDLQTGACFAETHLFYFNEKVAWTWQWDPSASPARGHSCVRKAQPTVNYECVPSGWTATGTTFIAGQKCTIWSDADGTHQQVALADTERPVLVQVIKRDSNGNVVEFAQIQDYRTTLPGGPSDLAVPSFCQR